MSYKMYELLVRKIGKHLKIQKLYNSVVWLQFHYAKHDSHSAETGSDFMGIGFMIIL